MAPTSTRAIEARPAVVRTGLPASEALRASPVAPSVVPPPALPAPPYASGGVIVAPGAPGEVHAEGSAAFVGSGFAASPDGALFVSDAAGTGALLAP